mgnify:CR=1 FL=1
MDIKLHKQATTTPKIRAEIQAAPSNYFDRHRFIGRWTWRCVKRPAKFTADRRLKTSPGCVISP